MLFDPELLITTGFGAACVCIVHKLINDKVLLAFIPTAIRHRIEKKKEEDKQFFQTCRANGTAFWHALITAPLCVYCMLFNHELRSNPVWGSCWPLVLAGWIMISYFIWDVGICLLRYKVYGPTFMIHAVVSLVGLLWQFSIIKHPLAQQVHRQPTLGYYLAVFMGTEISTPFLHIRWMLIKGKATKTLYFKIVNALFLFSFIFYRLFYVQIVSLLPVAKMALVDQIPYYTRPERLWILFTIVSWSSLNIFWGLLMVKSQFEFYFIRKDESKLK